VLGLLLMRHQRFFVTGIFGVLWFLCLASPAWATPRVINDNRLSYLKGLPNLGRGYNARQNSLQSVCFSKVGSTTPTFDFFYEIEHLTSEYVDRMLADGKDPIHDKYVIDFIKDVMGDEKLFSKQEHPPPPGRTITLIAEIKTDEYHHSLNEAKSTFTDSARKLLQKNRYVSFFNTCGFFYIRSVRMFSSYLAFFQFRASDDPEADTWFMSQIERGLISFGDDAKKAKKTQEEIEYVGGVRDLRLYIRALGLSKGKLINLVPTSIQDFRTTIQATAALMQDPDAGIVSEIEVVPWSDHPEVVRLMHTDNSDGTDEFSRVYNLEANSQVITSIVNQRDYWMDKYYFGSLCKRLLYEKFPTALTKTSLSIERYYDANKTLFANHNHSNNKELFVSLRHFKRHFRNHPPMDFISRVRNYLVGKKPGMGGDQCVKELHEQGLDRADFLSIPACVMALSEPPKSDRFVDEYCPPVSAEVVFDIKR
jgi:hypothetical protein